MMKNPPPATTPVGDPPFQRRKILVVEDNPDTAWLASQVLSSGGFEVDVACDGEGAVNKVAQDCFDLVLLDLRLPGMNGFEVCKHIKEKEPCPPVYFFTVSDFHADREKARECGADGYLVKPFRADDLVACIREAVEQSSSGPSAPVRGKRDL